MKPSVRVPGPVQLSDDAAYLGIVEGAPFGIVLVDADFKLIQLSQGAHKVFSVVRDPIGKDFAEVLGAIWSDPFLSDTLGRFRHTLATGESYHAPTTVERRAGSGATEAYDWKLERVQLPGGRWAVVCYFYDITDRLLEQERLRRGEEQQRLLLRLSDTLRPLNDPTEIMGEAARVIGQYLQTTWAYYVECDDPPTHMTILSDYAAGGAPSIKGVYPYRSLDLLQDLAQGRSVAINDMQCAARVSEATRAQFGKLGMRSFMGSPVVKGQGPLLAMLVVADKCPRAWTHEEMALLEEATARCWTAVERARSQDALRRSEERLKRMMDVPHVGVLTLDHEGHMLNANDAFLNMVGYSRAEFEARPFTWRDLTPPEYFAASERMMEQVRTTGLGAYEKEYYRKDGSRIWLSFAGADLGNGTIVEYVLDMRDRKEAERSLQHELASTQRLAELSTLMIHRENTMELVERVVDTAQALMGAQFASLQEVRDTSEGRQLVLLAYNGFNKPSADFWNVVDDSCHGSCAQAGRVMARVIIEDVEEQADLAGTKDLEHFQANGIRSMQSTPLITREGTWVGMMSTHWDKPHAPSPTDLRLFDVLARQAADLIERVHKDVALMQSVEKNRQAAEALLEADRRKDEFLATLAHELRNPLAPLRSGLEVVRSSTNDPATLMEIVGMMHRQVDQMVHLVDDLLDLSRISRGMIELRRKELDVQDALRQAIEANMPLLKAQGHRLTLDLAGTPLPVSGDATRLAQVFGNLLDNANKYTDPGGAITLSARSIDGFAEVSITDSGIGLAPDQLARVFDMFSQVDRTHDRTRGGLGIGLHIVKRLVEMHEGTIQVASEGSHQGTRFTVRLPLVGAWERKAEPVHEATRIAPLRILIADDNADAVKMLALLLTRAGHHVATAFSGTEALEQGMRARPQVVILDIGMPLMDGYETCRRLRATDWGSAAYVVALTGWGQSEDVKRSKEAGFDHHLVKPIDRRALMQMLATAHR